VPKELQGINAVRIGRWVVAGIVVLAAVGLPFLVAVRIQNVFSVVALSGIAGLSLVVLTGWAGQISLGQFGFVAVSAAVSGALSANAGWSFWLAVPAATIVTAAVAGIVGLPALRIRGLYLAVATFAFAIAVSEVFSSRRFLRDHLPRQVHRPTLFFLDFDEERSMYFLCLVALILAVIVVMNLRRSRFGRLLIASRENENDVQSFGVSLLRLKLLAFIVSGALAGFAGAIYAFQQRSVDPLNFGIDRSFQLFAYTVMGGVSAPAGALIGLAYSNVALYFFQNNFLWGFVIGLIPVIILYVAPGGVISILNQVRDSWLRIIAQRRQIVVPSLFEDYDPEMLEKRLIPLSEAGASQGLAALPVGQRYALESDLYAPPEDDGRPARETREIAAIAAASESE
jgi:branched-chain amino acid transport system permease protein